MTNRSKPTRILHQVALYQYIDTINQAYLLDTRIKTSWVYDAYPRFTYTSQKDVSSQGSDLEINNPGIKTDPYKEVVMCT